MIAKQNPFSIYDFLGYFVPGATVCYTIVAVHRIDLSIGNLAVAIVSDPPLSRAAELFPFVLCSYVVGHLVSFVSSAVIERYSIWQLGYPSAFLLDTPAQNFFAVNKPICLRLSYRVLVFVVLLPISLPDVLLGKFCRLREAYSRPLDDFLRGAIRLRVLQTLRLLHLEFSGDQIPRGSDYFRLIYHYCIEKAPAHVPKFQNYVALYGFLRTITLVGVMGWWWMVYSSTIDAYPALLVFRNLLFGSMFTYLLYMAFMKFYRRFSLEVLMSLVGIDNVDSANSE